MSWSNIRAVIGRVCVVGLCGLASLSPAEPPPGVQANAPVASYERLTNLVFNSEVGEYHANFGDAVATFSFQFTNVSDVPVHIIDISPSCHCTSAEMPQTPWIIPPHSSQTLNAKMQLAGKPAGENTKVLTILSTNGTRQLWVKAFLPDPAEMPMADRTKNQLLARADRQRIFGSDCAQCHVIPAVGKMGRELYNTACGICHDSPRRATGVPDLAALTHPVDAAFWKSAIEEGKTNTMMPAFAQSQGGPLAPAQVESLVSYLMDEFPKDHPSSVRSLPTAIRPPAPPGAADNSQSVGRPTAQSLKPRVPPKP